MVPRLQDERTIQTAHKLQFEHLMPPIVYYAVTEDATATEIFIKNRANHRLGLPNDFAAVATWKGVAWNKTDGAAIDGESGAFRVKNVDGTITFANITAGTQFVFAADDTNNAVKLTVTGTSGDVIIWKCRVDIVGVGELDIPNAADGEYNYDIP